MSHVQMYGVIKFEVRDVHDAQYISRLDSAFRPPLFLLDYISGGYILGLQDVVE